MQTELIYGAQNYASLPVVLSKGQGCWVWDTQGKKYLDFLGGYSALNHGHCHPQIIKVAQRQLSTLSMTSRAFQNDQLPLFLKSLSEIAGFEKVLPMNTGAEAVETAIKACRRWAYQCKGIPQDAAEIIVAENCFHGRTTTLISFSSDPNSRRGFGPFGSGFRSVPFGDVEKFRAAINPNTCAALFEPIQGEGGVIIPPENWLPEVYKISLENNILLILDEIQSGLGRSGNLFEFHHYANLKPHGLILGKSLGGGIVPVSAFLANHDVMDVFDPGSHGSTFGGNPLAAAVGREALRIIIADQYPERSQFLGHRLREVLETWSFPFLTDIRSRGLWAGLEFDPQFPKAKKVAMDLLDYGLLTKETKGTVLRLSPPLMISETDLLWGLEQFERLLKTY